MSIMAEEILHQAAHLVLLATRALAAESSSRVVAEALDHPESVKETEDWSGGNLPVDLLGPVIDLDNRIGSVEEPDKS